MIVVDSSGWLHYFMNGQVIERYVPYLSKSSEILTPTVVVYEVFKKVKVTLGENTALSAAAMMGQTNLVPLTDEIAYFAVDIALDHKLSMADAIIYATAKSHGAKLVTSDADFKALPDVTYIPSEE